MEDLDWGIEKWSRRSGLNRRPVDYESTALPLCYAGNKSEGIKQQ